MSDTTTVTTNPADYLPPVSGKIPVLLIIGVYIIAFVLILNLFKKS